MGRAEDNDVVIDSPSISLHHAIMERTPRGFQLRDLGSTNGTKLGGAIQSVIDLSDGIRCEVGDVDFHFTLKPEEQQQLAQHDAPRAAEPIHAEPEPSPAPAPPPPNPVVSFLSWLLFFAFAFGAFGLGLSIRYSQRHPGHGFMQDLKTAFAPAPAEKEEPE
jgi:pSer/pThr/pTyr-binding forkhead associated (FHA) protein